ncbi:hypothetical protein [Aeromonas dhakensis]|uniref:hypothetical protein n=1 Tax=Aeromonas dhakensis TaxID=196024 RepID=UPI003F746830
MFKVSRKPPHRGGFALFAVQILAPLDLSFPFYPVCLFNDCTVVQSLELFRLTTKWIFYKVCSISVFGGVGGSNPPLQVPVAKLFFLMVLSVLFSMSSVEVIGLIMGANELVKGGVMGIDVVVNASKVFDVVNGPLVSVITGLVASGVAPHLFKVSLNVGALDL